MPGFLPTDYSFYLSHPPSCEKADCFFGHFFLSLPIPDHWEPIQRPIRVQFPPAIFKTQETAITKEAADAPTAKPPVAQPR